MLKLAEKLDLLENKTLKTKKVRNSAPQHQYKHKKKEMMSIIKKLA